MKNVLQTNGIAILVLLHVLLIWLAVIRYYERKPKKIVLDEHEEKFSEN